MPKFLEDKLKAEAAKKGLTGREAERYEYGAMNNMGAMHGNQETPKGKAMDRKHERDVASGGTKGGKEHTHVGHFVNSLHGNGVKDKGC